MLGLLAHMHCCSHLLLAHMHCCSHALLAHMHCCSHALQVYAIGLDQFVMLCKMFHREVHK